MKANSKAKLNKRNKKLFFFLTFMKAKLFKK